MIKKWKKFFTIAAISSLAVIIFMLICAIFGAKVFKGIYLNILLSLITITVVSTFFIPTITTYGKNKTIAVISSLLLALSLILVMVLIWANEGLPNVFFKIISLVVLNSILFNIIVSSTLNLSKKYLSLKICTYVVLAILDVLISICILIKNLFKLDGFGQVFSIICIVALGLIIAVKILGRKNVLDEISNYHSDDVSNKTQIEKVSVDNRYKEENKVLKLKIKSLELEIEFLKSELNKLNKNEKDI